MDKNKSPFVGYTLKEIKQLEDNYFILQLGGDFVTEDNCFLFTKAEANKLFDLTMNDLVGIVRDGEPKDRDYAIDLISGMAVRQLRYH